MRADILERIQILVTLIPLFPLAGAILNGLLGRRFSKGLVTTIACGMPLLAFLCGILAFRNLRLLVLDPYDRNIVIPVYTWMQADMAGDRLDIVFRFLFDPLSSVMVLVVTGVGFLIHVYSTGYMAKDPGYRRYFAYLNLFLFSMLVLVLGDNLPLLFVGWEGVGLCSYLLIGFWFEDPQKADAGKKAFIVNRVGDLGFLLGMMMYFVHFGTLGFAGESRQAVMNLLPDVAPAAVTTIALLLFVGAVGKSAQIPLQIWLPDAMAGPTPVSALIHAATMVTAGVYLVARMNFLYASAPIASWVIAVVGAATALLAGIAAIPQRDIKRTLAYSTISQLGFMFLAVGLGAYAAGIFHLVTHAFFKALLFLGAGAVIHALHGEQDMFRMGGLSRPLRLIFWTMLAGILALGGIFPLAGFWSKDEILLEAFEQKQYVLWIVGLAAALCTAYYGARLLCLTFLGNGSRTPSAHAGGDLPHHGSEAAAGHGLHLPGFAMSSVLVVLAVLSFFGGVIGLPHAGGIAEFLKPVFPEKPPAHPAHVLSPALMNAALTTVLALLSGGIAWYFYTAGSKGLQAWSERQPIGRRLHRLASSGFGFDWLYEQTIVRLLRTGSFLLWLVVDVLLIDTLCVHGPAAVLRRLGDLVRRLQSGLVSHYASVLTLGSALALAYLLHRMTTGGLLTLMGF